MRVRTIYLDELLGRKVYDPDGRCAGRIEEAIASTRDGCVIEEFLLGRPGLLERLSIAHFANRLLRALGAIESSAWHRVPWEQMDLSDPRRPRLRCLVSELRKMR